MSLTGLYRDKDGKVRPESRSPEGSVYVLEMIFKVIGGIFTVCFPLATMLLFSMSRDVRSISEKVIAVTTTQINQIATVTRIEAESVRNASDIKTLSEKVAVLEQRYIDHEAKDKQAITRLKRGGGQ